jgi:Vitamin B12 dependent methionine synthase, activation domain
MHYIAMQAYCAINRLLLCSIACTLYSCNRQTWELRGRYPNRGYPKIFQDATVGAEAQKLFDDAQVMLKDIVANKRLSLTGVLGIYPANRYTSSIQYCTISPQCIRVDTQLYEGC